MSQTPSEATYEGVWWLPGTEQERLGGILELGRTFELRTLGLFRDDRESPLRGRDDIVINGVVHKRAISLFSCRLYTKRSNLGGYGGATFRVGWALRGLFCIQSDAEAVFDHVRFSLTNLLPFANRPTAEHFEVADRAIAVQHRSPPTLEVAIPGALIRLVGTIGWSDGSHAASLMGRERFELTLDTPLTFDEIERRYIRPLRYLVALASGEFCDIEEFQVAQGFHADERMRHLWFDVDPYRGRWDPPVLRNVDSADMLLTLGEYDFASLISKWFDLVNECGSTIDLIFALDGPGNIFVSNRFFNAASAVEGLHQQLYPETPEQVRANQERIDRIARQFDDKEERAWLRAHLAGSHRPFLRQRLAVLLSQAGSTMHGVIGDPDAWTQKIKKLRDKIGHGANEVEVDLSAQVRLTQSLDLLYRTILLRRIGLTDDECSSRILTRRNWSYLPAAMQRDVPDIFLDLNLSSPSEQRPANADE